MPRNGTQSFGSLAQFYSGHASLSMLYTTYYSMLSTFANSRRITRVSSHLRSIRIRVNIEIAINAISLLDGCINYERKRI